jgi:carbon starvation protein
VGVVLDSHDPADSAPDGRLSALYPARAGAEVSIIGVGLLFLAIIGGGWIAESSPYADFWTFSPNQIVFALIAYGFIASVLPVWVLLAPRDYLSTFMKIGTIMLLAIGIMFTLPSIQMPKATEFAFNGQGPGLRRSRSSRSSLSR